MTRLTVDITDDQSAALDRLKESLNCTKTDMLRDGLRLFRMAAAEAHRGGRIAIVSGDGTVSPLIGAWSDVSPARA
jgi:hypothetical protein